MGQNDKWVMPVMLVGGAIRLLFFMSREFLDQGAADALPIPARKWCFSLAHILRKGPLLTRSNYPQG